MSKTFSFEDLNFKNLRAAANQWASRFPALKEVTLHAGDAGHSNAKYVFVVIYDEQDEAEKWDLLNWGWESCMHIEKALLNFYQPHSPEPNYSSKWMWFPIPVGQPLNLEGFVCKSPVVRLFPDNQSESPEINEAEEAERKRLEAIQKETEEKARKEQEVLEAERAKQERRDREELERQAKQQAEIDIRRKNGIPDTVSENYFIKSGHFWQIGFAGERTQLRDSKGLQYLVKIIEAGEKGVFVLELIQDGRAGKTGLSDNIQEAAPDLQADYSEMCQQQLTEEGLSIQDFSEEDPEVIPGEYRQQLKKKFEDLQANIEAGNPEERRKARDEFNKIIESLKKLYGYEVRFNDKKEIRFIKKQFGKRPKDFVNKARMTVQKGVKSAIENCVAAVPALEECLKGVRTGATCYYNSALSNPIHWDIRWE